MAGSVPDPRLLPGSQDVFARLYDGEEREIKRVFRAALRASKRHQTRCPHCGKQHEVKVKDFRVAVDAAVRLWEAKFGRVAQRAQPVERLSPQGGLKELEKLSNEELYALAYPDEEDSSQVADNAAPPPTPT